MRPKARRERLFRFLASLMMCDFYGSVAIRFGAGKVTHAATEARRIWQYSCLAATEPRIDKRKPLLRLVLVLVLELVARAAIATTRTRTARSAR